MRTITKKTKVYKFSELPEEARQKALEKHYDINVDHEWYDFIYDEAEGLGFKITGFDLYRGQSIDGELISSGKEIAEKIIKEHGKNCNTYKTALDYLNEIKQVSGIDEVEIEEKLQSLNDEFFQNILDCYFKILQDNYDYYTSEEAIVETLEANDYEFTIDGEIYS